MGIGSLAPTPYHSKCLVCDLTMRMASTSNGVSALVMRMLVLLALSTGLSARLGGLKLEGLDREVGLPALAARSL